MERRERKVKRQNGKKDNAQRVNHYLTEHTDGQKKKSSHPIVLFIASNTFNKNLFLCEARYLEYCF